MPISKRNKKNESLIPKTALEAESAVSMLKKFDGPKFDQSVDVCIHLGVDTKQADQMLRGSVSLPKGIGKSKRVVAFCPSDVAPLALEAGAIKAGGEELVAEIEKGFQDFDVAVTSPDMMRVISKLGRVLGPRGLMPSPKNGTVTPNVPDTVREFAAGKVEYRTDKSGNIHAVIGKMSFPDSDLLENLNFCINTIEKIRPTSVKGIYIKKITLSGTMTPGIQLRHEETVAS
jgi:large subunit ribosomal protein L1